MSEETLSEENTTEQTGSDASRNSDRWFDALAALAVVTIVIVTVIYWVSSQ